MFEKGTVVTLIDKEACFLTFEPIDVEEKAVLHCHILCAASEEESVLCRFEIGLERECGLTLIIYVADGVAHHFLECLGYLVTIDVHSGRVCLHDGCMVVEIDDKAGKIVTFAVYKAAGIVGFCSDKTESLTEVTRNGETAYPEIVIDLFFPECEHTYGDAAYLIVSGSYVLLVGCIYFNYLSFFRIALYTGYGAGKHPRVKAEKRFFLLGF